MRFPNLLMAAALMLGLATGAAAQDALTVASLRAPSPEDEIETQPIRLTAGVYAIFHTSDGDFLVRLLRDRAPRAVENFVGLANGSLPWTHPVTEVRRSDALFNNTEIYEAQADFYIRGGDPINKGTGGPGWRLPIEAAESVAFSDAGILAMQNDGTEASGSRWFITLTQFPTSDRHSIFGRVEGGLGVVRKISRRPAKRPAVPLQPALVSNIEIVEVPAGTETTATFLNEDGKFYLNIDRDFRTATAPPPTPAIADTPTSPTLAGDAETTETADGDDTTTPTEDAEAPPASPM